MSQNTFVGTPLSLARYEGSNRFAYVVDGHGVTVPEGSRAVYFAKQAVRRHKPAEVWSRNNSGDWLLDEKYQSELEKQVATESTKADFYIEPKGPTAKTPKTGFQAALMEQAALSKTLAHNMAQGFTLDARDYANLEAVMTAVLEYIQPQGPELPPTE